MAAAAGTGAAIDSGDALNTFAAVVAAAAVVVVAVVVVAGVVPTCNDIAPAPAPAAAAAAAEDDDDDDDDEREEFMCFGDLGFGIGEEDGVLLLALTVAAKAIDATVSSTVAPVVSSLPIPLPSPSPALASKRSAVAALLIAKPAPGQKCLLLPAPTPVAWCGVVWCGVK